MLQVFKKFSLWLVEIQMPPNSKCSLELIMLLSLIFSAFTYYSVFPGGSDGKVSVYNAGDLGLIPGLGRSPGEGNGNPLQYYCLENPMDRRDW